MNNIMSNFEESQVGKTLKILSIKDDELICLSYNDYTKAKYLTAKNILDALQDVENSNIGLMPFKIRNDEYEFYQQVVSKEKRLNFAIIQKYNLELATDVLLIDIDAKDEKTDIERETVAKAIISKSSSIIGVASTGNGLLVALKIPELRFKIEDKEQYDKILNFLNSFIRSYFEKTGILAELEKFDFQIDDKSLEATKSIRFIGTFNYKRKKMSKWLEINENATPVDTSELLGIDKKLLEILPLKIAKKLENELGISFENVSIENDDELQGKDKEYIAEQIFAKISEFYSNLAGQRNNILLLLSADLKKAGIEKEKAIELYDFHLSHLEDKDKPESRIKQTIKRTYSTNAELKTLRTALIYDEIQLPDGYKEKLLKLLSALRNKSSYTPYSFKKFMRVYMKGKKDIEKEIENFKFANFEKMYAVANETHKTTIYIDYELLYVVKLEYKRESADVPFDLSKAEYIDIEKDYKPCVSTIIRSYLNVVKGYENSLTFNACLSNVITYIEKVIETLLLATDDYQIVRALLSKYTKMLEGIKLNAVFKKASKKLAETHQQALCLSPLITGSLGECNKCEYSNALNCKMRVIRKYDNIENKTEISIEVEKGDSKKIYNVKDTKQSFAKLVRDAINRELSEMEKDWLHVKLFETAINLVEFENYEIDTFIEIINENADMFVDIKDDYVLFKSGQFTEILKKSGLIKSRLEKAKLLDRLSITAFERKVRTDVGNIYVVAIHKKYFENDVLSELEKIKAEREKVRQSAESVNSIISNLKEKTEQEKEKEKQEKAETKQVETTEHSDIDIELYDDAEKLLEQNEWLNEGE